MSNKPLHTDATESVAIHFDIPVELLKLKSDGDKLIEWMKKALDDCNYVQLKKLPANGRHNVFRKDIFYMDDGDN